MLARFHNGQWFALPNGEGSDVGPFATEEEALDWLCGDPAPDEDPFEQAERLALRLGFIQEANERNAAREGA